MEYRDIEVGLVITGSFCTFNEFEGYISELADTVKSVTPIFSESAKTFDTKFNTAAERRGLLEQITGKKAICSIIDAECIGPNKLFDIIVVAPCTGNTLAKLANGITDTTATMAVKAHLRNNRPVVIGISSNDVLGQNAKNLGILLNSKNYYFIPFYQDDPVKKEKSVIFRCELLIDTIEKALEGKQLQPLFR
jgi:dipicolinate synthase subunit B